MRERILQVNSARNRDLRGTHRVRAPGAPITHPIPALSRRQRRVPTTRILPRRAMHQCAQECTSVPKTRAVIHVPAAITLQSMLR